MRLYRQPSFYNFLGLIRLHLPAVPMATRSQGPAAATALICTVDSTKYERTWLLQAGKGGLCKQSPRVVGGSARGLRTPRPSVVQMRLQMLRPVGDT